MNDEQTGAEKRECADTARDDRTPAQEESAPAQEVSNSAQEESRPASAAGEGEIAESAFADWLGREEIRERYIYGDAALCDEIVARYLAELDGRRSVPVMRGYCAVRPVAKPHSLREAGKIWRESLGK